MPHRQANDQRQIARKTELTSAVITSQAHQLRAIKLNQILQQSLQLDHLLDTFANEIQTDVSFSGLQYTHKIKDYEYIWGMPSQHTAIYQLHLSDQYLGDLVFFNQNPFPATALSLLEELVPSLFYPLNNALAYQDALHCALLDPLTQVGNRRALMLTLGKEIELAKRHPQDITLLMMDLDYFKHLNDVLGHPEGDKIIQDIAKTIKSTVRESDIVFRYGGDEFIVVMISTNLEGSKQLAERLRQAVNAQLKTYHDQTDDKLNTVSMSLGLTMCQPQDNTESLIHRADQALYEAKRLGKNQIYVI